jgi:hypothetical protein
MRIAFITSSLAPGKDGVGDYTRDLAAACESLGRSCVLLALNDRHIDRPSEQRQSARGTTLESLRLPASTPWAERLLTAQRWLERERPDWISLQMVAYGYHRKGLIGPLCRRLAPLVGARPLHVMLHELWIGMERGAPLRRQLIGAMQRQAVLALIRHMRPALVHTSNAAYAKLLAIRGVQARLLPLCGNIPVAARPDMEWLGHELIKLGVPIEPALSRDRCWRFGMFGSLHPGWTPEPLFTQIAEVAARAGREVVITSIGRRGPCDSLWQAMQRRYGERFFLAALGERDANEVSVFLQSVDFGVALTPWQLIGKSGATAAMLDHGVPIVVSGEDVDYGLESLAPASTLLYRLDANFPRWLHSAKGQPPRSRLSDMAAQFVADVEASTSPNSEKALKREYGGVDVLRQTAR